MGFYARRILPRLLDLAMRNREASRLRAEWIPKAQGNVLEIGIGSGLNLPFYSAEVKRIYGLDPSVELQRMAQKRASQMPMQIEFFTQPAEESIPLEPASIDTVVLTWTLCSTTNPAQALEQATRTLKPGGRLIFIEHGRAPEPGVAAWQDRLTPVWKCIGGGCHLNRGIESLIQEAGFKIMELQKGYLPGPRPMTYTYQGVARPSLQPRR